MTYIIVEHTDPALSYRHTGLTAVRALELYRFLLNRRPAPTILNAANEEIGLAELELAASREAEAK